MRSCDRRNFTHEAFYTPWYSTCFIIIFLISPSADSWIRPVGELQQGIEGEREMRRMKKEQREGEEGRRCRCQAGGGRAQLGAPVGGGVEVAVSPLNRQGTATCEGQGWGEGWLL